MLQRLVSKLIGRKSHAPFCVVSHPKSGRTWLRVMLDDLGIRADYNHGRATKGRQHFNELTAEVQHDYRRTVVLIRDPRDTRVSGFHQLTKRAREEHRFEGTMAEYLRDPSVGIEKAARFNLLWAEAAAKRDDMMVITYEDMRAEPVEVLSKVATFFGARPSRQKISEVVERNEFSRMQERERSGEFGKKYGRPLQPRNPDDPSSFKVRRGVVGGFRDELTDDDVAYCEGVLAELDYFRRIERALDSEKTVV